MNDLWKLNGETLRARGAENVQVECASLAEDFLSWDVWLEDVTDSGPWVPALAAEVSLHHGATRVFRGHVTRRTPLYSAGRMGYRVVVSGPWFFLAKTKISEQVADQTEVEAERAVYLFETGSPRDFLNALVSRAISVGVPISLGSMATVYDVPRLSLREMSYAEAISEVMRWVPDGMVFFDYSGTGHPAIGMQRRGSASTVTLDPTILAVRDVSVRPRVDLQVAEVQVISARRVTAGDARATEYAAEGAGTATGILSNRQIVVSTGPEIDTFLPQDFGDTVVVKSESFDAARVLMREHDILRSAQATGLVVTGEPFEDVLGGGGVGGGYSGGGFVQRTLWPSPAVLRVTDRDGDPVDSAEWPFVLSKGEVRAWWEKDGIEYLEGRVTGTIVQSQIDGADDFLPEWAALLGAQARSHLLSVVGGVGKRNYYTATVSAPCVFVKTLWAAETTLIRSEDWGWYNPPEGLAENLRAAQDWLPYEGLIPCAVDDVPVDNAVGAKLNVSSWLPETASMGALITRMTRKPATGEVIYQLGPPVRHSYRDLVNRFRQSGADNIFWLSGQQSAAEFDLDPTLPAGALVFGGSALMFDDSVLIYTP